MVKKEKEYARVPAAEEIIKELCKKYPDALWAVKPENVAVLGVDNVEKPEKNKVLAKIKAIRGSDKALLKLYNVPVRYVITLYCSDWNKWTENLKQWVMFHELLHITAEVGSVVKHDCEDFMLILDAAGVNWSNRTDLPSLLNSDVKFNLDLRPNMLEYCEENDIDVDGKKDDKEDKD